MPYTGRINFRLSCSPLRKGKTPQKTPKTRAQRGFFFSPPPRALPPCIIPGATPPPILWPYLSLPSFARINAPSSPILHSNRAARLPPPPRSPRPPPSKTFTRPYLFYPPPPTSVGPSLWPPGRFLMLAFGPIRPPPPCLPSPPPSILCTPLHYLPIKHSLSLLIPALLRPGRISTGPRAGVDPDSARSRPHW